LKVSLTRGKVTLSPNNPKGAMTLSITTLSIATLRITTPSIKYLFVTLTQHKEDSA